MPIIALLTDYGTTDGYVGAIKGVIAGIAPATSIIDITHDVPPYDIAHGAFVLGQVWNHFPVGTISLVVVDPGVGSSRRIILGEFGGRFAVAPDNGLLTFVAHDHPTGQGWVAANKKYFLPEVSSTFHGRDILAPVAAHHSLGVEPSSFGPPADLLERLSTPCRSESQGDGWRGRIIHIDRFGTLVSNIHRDQLAKRQGTGKLTVSVNGTEVGPIRSAFHEVPIGQPLAMIGSSGFLEIAVNQGRAADRFPTHAEIRCMDSS